MQIELLHLLAYLGRFQLTIRLVCWKLSEGCKQAIVIYSGRSPEASFNAVLASHCHDITHLHGAHRPSSAGRMDVFIVRDTCQVKDAR